MLGGPSQKVPHRGVATKNALLRASKLLLMGLVLQGGFFHGLNHLTYGVDLQHMRWMGILQVGSPTSLHTFHN